MIFPIVLRWMKLRLLDWKHRDTPILVANMHSRLRYFFILLVLISILPVTIVFGVMGANSIDAHGELPFLYWTLYTQPYTRSAEFVMGMVIYFVFLLHVDAQRVDRLTSTMATMTHSGVESNRPAAPESIEIHMLGMSRDNRAPLGRSDLAHDYAMFDHGQVGSTASPVSSNDAGLVDRIHDLSSSATDIMHKSQMEDLPRSVSLLLRCAAWLDAYTLLLIAFFIVTAWPWTYADGMQLNIHRFIAAGSMAAPIALFLLLVAVADADGVVTNAAADVITASTVRGAHIPTLPRVSWIIHLLRTRILVEFGEVSFAFYVLHVALRDFMQQNNFSMIHQSAFCFFLMSLGIAVITHKYIEVRHLITNTYTHTHIV